MIYKAGDPAPLGWGNRPLSQDEADNLNRREYEDLTGALPNIAKITITITETDGKLTVLTFETDLSATSLNVSGVEPYLEVRAEIKANKFRRDTGVPLPPYTGEVQFKAGSREAAIYLGQRHWIDSQGNVHWLDEEGHEIPQSDIDSIATARHSLMHLGDQPATCPHGIQTWQSDCIVCNGTVIRSADKRPRPDEGA